MKRYILTALAIASLAGQLFAEDLKITFNKETKAMSMTQKSEEVNYYSTRFQRTSNAAEKTDTLIDYKDFIFYAIDHSKKTIAKTTLDDLLKVLKQTGNQMQGMDAQTKAIMQGMFGGGSSGPAKTEKLGQETVAGRSCTIWKITIGKNVYNISADPDLELPIAKAALEKASMLKDASAMALPGMGDIIEKLYPEMAKIKGTPLKQDIAMSIGPVSSKTLLVATKIEKGAIPASMFELPNGYKMEDVGKKMLADLQKSQKR